MRTSTTILTTIALGAALAMGSATASMARGHDTGDRDHAGSFGQDHGFGGDHGYGETLPFIVNNGTWTTDHRVRVDRSVVGEHGFSVRRHNGHRYLDGLLGFDPFFGSPDAY